MKKQLIQTLSRQQLNQVIGGSAGTGDQGGPPIRLLGNGGGTEPGILASGDGNWPPSRR
ncbi:hypothetical protein [Pseudoalteromonas byunsanensis]|uniref:hypothetical protein n=1 Tax=Pseudoalteromonas byunsanensis TaxID=327939 RepID=UPI0015866A80|nr:hypothetical protein [Pseudoalteromonas byunsanensis]